MTTFSFLDGLSLSLQTCFVMVLLHPYCCCLVGLFLGFEFGFFFFLAFVLLFNWFLGSNCFFFFFVFFLVLWGK